MSDEFTAGGCNPSDCASCGGGCSSAGGCDPVENHKTITLTMEDDTEVECAILTAFPGRCEGIYRTSPHLMRTVRMKTARFTYTHLPVLRAVIRCFPTSKATKNMQKLQLLLTQFSRMQKILWIRLTDLLKNFICKTKIRTIIIS